MADKPPLFVDAHQLHTALDRDDIQIVAVDTAVDFASGHIPGALRLDMSDFTASEPPVGGLLPTAGTLSALFSRIGLRNDAWIIAYDRAGDAQAARLLYTLDVMGHKSMSLLDGGLASWQAAGLDLETGAFTPANAGNDFQVDRQPERIADLAWIESHLSDANTTLLDTRSADEYAGHDVRAARGGHIPGAVNLDWRRLKTTQGRLRPQTELTSLLAEHGIRKNKEVVVYCQTHTRSSYVYWALKALGHDRLRGYPGAWSQWGNTGNTPVSVGATRS